MGRTVGARGVDDEVLEPSEILRQLGRGARQQLVDPVPLERHEHLAPRAAGDLDGAPAPDEAHRTGLLLQHDAALCKT